MAKTLKSVSQSDRSALFRALVTAATLASGSSAAGSSGEVGFCQKGGLIPAVGDAAFADAVHTGDAIGPIATSAGSQLFLVEAR